MATRSLERTDFLGGVLVTAVEGGVNYWAEPRCYDWREDERHNFTHVAVELREDGSSEWRKVGLDTIERGIEAIRSGRVSLNREITAAIWAGDSANDAGEIDAEGADCIVQAGLFNELVYG